LCNRSRLNNIIIVNSTYNIIPKLLTVSGLQLSSTYPKLLTLFANQAPGHCG